MILIINTGSSSIKFRLYQKSKIILDGVIEESSDDLILNYTIDNKKNTKTLKNITSFKLAADIILSLIMMELNISPDKIEKIAYRVVHGGNLKSPLILTHSNFKEIEKLVPLAPLHLPSSLEVISHLMKNVKSRHIAVFDNSFHRTMPEIASIYALPQDLTKKYHIKRYGFHGIAHENLLNQARKHIKNYSKIITCQLGNGSSICAIKNGKSIDTSMGFTPLEGVIMGTRSGNIDPAIIPFLAEHSGLHLKEIKNILEKESGLKGLEGESDVRSLLQREKKGDKKASLALDMFAYTVKKQIGAYIAALGGVDAIVLGGGISRSPIMRKKILSNMENLGITLDKSSISKIQGLISKGKVKVFVFETDEQDQIYNLIKTF